MYTVTPQRVEVLELIVSSCLSGYLWYLQVKLPPAVNLLQDKGKLMDFLLRRRDCKMVILSVCSQSTSVSVNLQMKSI